MNLFRPPTESCRCAPLSCLLLNALVWVLTKSANDKVDMTIQSYVDDITFITKNLDQLRQGLQHLEPYLELTDQKLNIKKTYAFAVNDEMCELTFQGETLPNQ